MAGMVFGYTIPDTFTTEWKDFFTWAGNEQQKQKKVKIILIAGALLALIIFFRAK
jgi:hypothetical protein